MILKKYYSLYSDIEEPLFNKLKEKYRKSKRRKDKERKKRYSYKVYKTVKFADHMKPCNCIFCINPRKSFKQITLQELKSKLSEKDYDVLE